MSGMSFQSHAMQSHAKSCKIMQCMQVKQAGWVTHLLGQFYSPVATFHLYSGLFRWLERNGCLPPAVSEIQIGVFMLFLPETIFIHMTLQKSNFLQYRFCSIDEHKGACSKESDWGHLVLTIGLSQSSGSPFVFNNLYAPRRSCQLPLLINLPWNNPAGINAQPLI